MLENFQAVLSVLGMLVGFVIILALAYGATRLLGKRYGMTQGGNGAVRVVDRTPLGQDRMVCVVQVADRTLLLGVTPQSVNLLCELEGDKLPPPQKETVTEPFSDVLRSVLRGNAAKGEKEARDD